MNLTYFETKLLPVPNSLAGGKIAEKANVLGNAKNTGVNRRASILRNQGLISGINSLNSVCLNKISLSFSGRMYSTQELTLHVNRSESLLHSTESNSSNPLSIREEVELKQKQLVRLAERHGLFDHRVQHFQLILIRSKLFRQHAATLIWAKPGSQTPGIDNEIFDKQDKYNNIELLVEYLRDMTYHPNKYLPSPVKRV